jgi:hypothetical protein
MTIFDRSKLNFDGLYLMYDDRFVAKFKYQRRSIPSFKSFLARNFSVEEYFTRLEAGESPLSVLQSKGYIQPFMRRVLLDAGLPPTPAGREEYLRREALLRAGRQAAEATLVPSHNEG